MQLDCWNATHGTTLGILAPNISEEVNRWGSELHRCEDYLNLFVQPLGKKVKGVSSASMGTFEETQ